MKRFSIFILALALSLALAGVVRAETYRDTLVDRETGQRVIITSDQSAINDGEMFVASLFNATSPFASNTNYNCTITTPASGDVVLKELVVMGDDGPVLVEIFEDATLTSGGSTWPSYNLNRGSTATASTALEYNDTNGTVTDDSSPIFAFLTGDRDTETKGILHEIILDRSSSYLIRISNKNATVTYWGIQLIWQER